MKKLFSFWALICIFLFTACVSAVYDDDFMPGESITVIGQPLLSFNDDGSIFVGDTTKIEADDDKYDEPVFENDDNATKSNEMDDNFDEHAFYYYHPYSERFYSFSLHISYVGNEQFYEWVNQKEGFLNSEKNLYRFIKDFNIPKDEYILLINDKLGYKLTDEMVDALYSDDMREINRLFIGEHATYHNGEAYAPVWFVEHTYDEYVKEGLPDELIFTGILKCKINFPFAVTDQMKRAEANLIASGYKAEDYFDERTVNYLNNYEEIIESYKNPEKKKATEDDIVPVTGTLIGDGKPLMFRSSFGIGYFAIPPLFVQHVGLDAFAEWVSSQNEYNFFNNDGVRLDFSFAKFLDDFGISKEGFRQICPITNENDGIWGISDEMMEAYYSESAEFIYGIFPNQYALLNDGKVYTPAWLATHTYTEYMDEGLSIDKILSTLEYWSENDALTQEKAQIEEMLHIFGTLNDIIEP